MDNITLIGMPGSGKSTVGVLLAKAMGLSFLDVDLLIQQREGQLLQEILDDHGVDHFLDAEEAAVKSIHCSRTVIAPGGSAVLREKGAEHLRSLGPVVYLNVPVEELERRLRGRGTDSEEVILKRIGKAEFELSKAPEFDKVVVNDVLDVAVDETTAIIENFLK